MRKLTVSVVKPVSAIVSGTVIPVPSPHLCPRYYATQTSLGGGGADANKTPKQRRAVTPFNDNGHVPWSQLSVLEKAGRATQQSLNYGFVAVGLVLTGGVGYFLWTDLFRYDSTTNHFNRAVDRIKSDPRCIELLGDPSKIVAHGDETFNKWRKSRPISAETTVDKHGTEHLIMRFYVEGQYERGAVGIHLLRGAKEESLHYKYFFLDVEGHQRLYLEKADERTVNSKKISKLFGLNWR